MEWIILFIVSWIIFFLMSDWKSLKRDIWAGLLAIVFALLVDQHNVEHGNYIITKKVFDILKSDDIFFLFGPVFVVGTLITQLHPKKKLFIIFNILVLVFLFFGMEYILVKRGAIIYKDWHFYDSLLYDFGAIIALSWFSMVVLGSN